MSRLLRRIKLLGYRLYYSLFFGLSSADHVAFGQKTVGGDDDNSTGVNVVDEKKSVYKDMLRGEVTQEVRELRHEMYYAERESHKYRYVGGGKAVKKNEIFNPPKGLENSEGLPIQISQENREDEGGTDEGLKEAMLNGTKERREFTIKAKRGFIPKFRLEEFTNKLVVKRIDDEHVLLDFYTTMYPSQFNRRQRMFINEVDKVYMGDVQCDMLFIDEVSFVTYKAYGAEDLKEFAYNDLKYENIVKYNGDYVLKFTAAIVKDGEDLIEEFFDEETDRKCREHAPRNEKDAATADFYSFMAKKNEPSTTEEEDLMRSLGL